MQRLTSFSLSPSQMLMIATMLGFVGTLRAQTSTPASEAEVQQLREEVRALRQELAEMHTEIHKGPASPGITNGTHVDKFESAATGGTTATFSTVAQDNTSNNVSVATQSQPASTAEKERTTLPAGTTLNLTVDGYYGWNFNRPVGRVNLLRAYDVSANNFSLNQASVIIERAPDVNTGRRWGARLDLQFGQATATLQGSPANELRPSVYQNVFQAYGTYIVPVGSGLNIDFGKFASSLGIEGNYTKDQINYSRSFWFDFLPFYHTGVRANYKFNDKFALNYWIVNGTQQTESVNNFKDQFFGLTIQPAKSMTWNMNYYVGQEHRDVTQILVPGAPVTPGAQPGISITPIFPAPDGKLHIFDTYVSWQATKRTSLAAEADYVIQRLWQDAAPGRSSAPSHTDGGALYVRYQLTRRSAIAARAEYVSDRGGQFTGITQALKENTLTYDYKLGDGFILRPEWRRDFSNRPYFLTRAPGVLKKDQNTATVGLIWAWGGKEGAW